MFLSRNYDIASRNYDIAIFDFQVALTGFRSFVIVLYIKIYTSIYLD